MVSGLKEKFREAFKQKSADDKDVVEGNIKTRCVVGSDQWFSNCVPQKCLRAEETEAAVCLCLHYDRSFLITHPILSRVAPLTCSHTLLL